MTRIQICVQAQICGGSCGHRCRDRYVCVTVTTGIGGGHGSPTRFDLSVLAKILRSPAIGKMDKLRTIVCLAKELLQQAEQTSA